MSSFWLYGIEYGYRFESRVLKDFKRDTGQCLHSLFYNCLKTAASDGVGGIFSLVDVQLAADVFYHLHSTTNKNASKDVFFDACIRSGFDLMDMDKDERLCCYAFIIWKLALAYSNEWKEEKVKELEKMQASTDTQSAQ